MHNLWKDDCEEEFHLRLHQNQPQKTYLQKNSWGGMPPDYTIESALSRAAIIMPHRLPFPGSATCACACACVFVDYSVHVHVIVVP